MSVLSPEAQKHTEELLVSSGILSEDKLNLAKKEAKKQNIPLISFLLNNKFISDEQLTKTNAAITKVPYVNLSSARIDPKILDLLPQEIAERYMAVPLGEMQHRLVVAMLDANNVQAVDFLSNRIARPLKVYVASEAGIRQVLKQYDARLDSKMKDAFNVEETAEQHAENI